MSKKEIIIDKKHYKINGEDLITAMENGLVSKEQYIGFLKGNINKLSRFKIGYGRIFKPFVDVSRSCVIRGKGYIPIGISVV